MSSVLYPELDIFLLGFVAACSFVAALFFFRFWRTARDFLFLAFAFFFIVQGVDSFYILSLSHPNQGSIGIFLWHFAGIIVVLGSILWKNLVRR